MAPHIERAAVGILAACLLLTASLSSLAAPLIITVSDLQGAAGTRYVLKKDRPLVLRYRFWIHAGKSDETKLADIWAAYANPPKIAIEK